MLATLAEYRSNEDRSQCDKSISNCDSGLDWLNELRQHDISDDSSEVGSSSGDEPTDATLSDEQCSHIIWDELSRPHGVPIGRLAESLKKKGLYVPKARLLFVTKRSCFRVFRPSLTCGKASAKLWITRSHMKTKESEITHGVPSPRLEKATEAGNQKPTKAFMDGYTPCLEKQADGIIETNEPRLAPFSHRRYEKQPDCDSMSTAFPVVNLPLISEELQPPTRQKEVVAGSLGEIVTVRTRTKLKAWRKRSDRMFKLALAGDLKAAKLARPKDLLLKQRKCTRIPFRKVRMDLTSLPYKSAQPTAWPENPPVTELSIRNVRREFRAHPEFTDKWVKGMVSHGCPEISRCQEDTFLAAPHIRALQHYPEWSKLVQAELLAGWGRTRFPDGWHAWPCRLNPSGIVCQKGSHRRTDDLSWPLEGNTEAKGTVSVNAASDFECVLYVRIAFIALACAIFLVAMVPVEIFYCDLSKAYKRCAEQAMAVWQRGFMTESGAQTLDRICFGQADGPSSFTRQSNHMRFIIVKEMDYANTCYPTRDKRVIAWIQVRRRAAIEAGGDVEAWCRLFFIMVFLDDFTGASIADLLFRYDGSKVIDQEGKHKKRSTLMMEVKLSAIARYGHRSGKSKEAWPCRSLVMLGVTVDLDREVMSLDPTKRKNYAEYLDEFFEKVPVRVTRHSLTRVAFRMLVVCECDPACRQWLHPVFRRLRGFPVTGSLPLGAEAEEALLRFRTRLRDGTAIEVPLAPRVSFPHPSEPGVLVKFDDASGKDDDNRASKDGDGPPGWGSCSVIDGVMCYMHGVWSATELSNFSITILETLTTVMSTFAYLDYRELGDTGKQAFTHVLEYTDNTGCEWSMRKETPHNARLQQLSAKRQKELTRRGVFVRTERVTSLGNKWADLLSRGHVERVIHEAGECGLLLVRLYPSESWRVSDWLISL